jgi:hypothetical protein
MIVLRDAKRRVVLPKSARPGEAFFCVESGDRSILERLKSASKLKPPVAPKRLKGQRLKKMDLDIPAFPPLSDEGIA